MKRQRVNGKPLLYAAFVLIFAGLAAAAGSGALAADPKVPDVEHP